MAARASVSLHAVLPLAKTISIGLALGCLGLGASACRKSHPIPPPARPIPTLGSVEIHDEAQDRGEAADLDVPAISAKVTRTLQASGLVQPSAPVDGGSSTSPVLRVVGRVGVQFVEVEKKGIVRAGVVLRLSTRPSDVPGAINDDLSAGGEEGYQIRAGLDRRGLAQTLVERTAVDLLGGFVARARLATATPAEVHAAIVGDGGALREEAIRVAGQRGLRDEAPFMLELLAADDESVRDAALGALIALQDRRAVAALTKSRSLRDRHEMRKILEAIAILGGQEARDYLSFVAESHDDEEIRKLAIEARERLGRRDEAGR